MSNWMEGVASGGRKLGVHDQGQLIQKTRESDAYGLRNVSRHSAEIEKTEFPSDLDRARRAGCDLPRGKFGIVNYGTPANNTLSVKDTLNADSISER